MSGVRYEDMVRANELALREIRQARVSHATVCVCGAPGGSRHDHFTGRVIAERYTGGYWVSRIEVRKGHAA